MLRDKSGNRLFRRIDVTVIFAPDSLPTRKLTQKAPPRKGFGPDDIDNILDSLTDQLDALYPWWQFRYTELAPIGKTAKFVFEYCGYRAPKEVTPAKDAAHELFKEGTVVVEVPARHQGQTNKLEQEIANDPTTV